MPGSRPYGVLVFPAGEVNSVELHDALATCVNIRLFGGSSVDRHGPYLFRNYIRGIPAISDPAFLAEFNRILGQHEIDVVFPTHDTVAEFLSARQDSLAAKIIAGDARTSALCRDKRLLYEHLASHPFVPRFYDTPGEVAYPAFSKPRRGSGSVGAMKLESAADLAKVDFGECVVAEYLPGEEFTVDCLTDRSGRLAVVSPRSRDRTMAGISVSGRSQPLTEEIASIAEAINREMSFLGLWFFQIKRDAGGRFRLLEVSTRCAGTMCLTRARGANLPLLSVYAAMGMDVRAFLNAPKVVVDRTLISRYHLEYDYDTVYLDFDDTVIVGGKVHGYSILFLYQCRSAGKRVRLLTRHAADIERTLREHCLDRGLFDQITVLPQDARKADHIDPSRSIFVDNAFAERWAVHQAHGIPVFDVDGLEVLIDWRT